MKKKNLLVLGALACGLLITSCGDSAEDTTTGYKLTVEKDSGVDSVTFTSDGAEVTNLTSLEEGTELTAKITLKDDYEISAVTLNGTAVNVTGGSYVFDMPATDSTFKVTTKEVVKTPEVKTFALTVEKDAGIKTVSVTKDGVALTDLTKVEEGSALVATVTPVEGYTVSAVTLDGEALTLKDGAYAFNMPSKAATLKVTSAEIPPEVSTITVTNDDTKGSYTLTKGTETVSDGKVNVGDTVKLTVVANTGYTVSAVTLDGNALSLADGFYEFTATAATHTIAITYEEVVNVSLTVYDEPVTNFYENVQLFSGETDVTDGAEVRVGSELKVVLTVDGEYNTFQENEYRKTLRYIYLHVGDQVFHGDDDNAEVSADFTTLTFTIAAPDVDTEIALSYNGYRAEEDDETSVSVTMATNDNLEFYGYNAADKYTSSRFKVGIKRTPGYVITKAILTYEDETSEEVTQTYYLPQFINDYASWTYGNALKGNVTISFEGEVKEVYAIKYVNGDKVKADAVFETNKIAGESVSVNNIKSSDSSKTISEIKFTGVECTANYNSYYDAWSYSFVMPENEVTIEFVFEDLVPLAYTPNDNIETVVFRSSNTTYNDSNIIQYAKAGSKVFAFATAKEGFLLGDATGNDGKKYELKNTYGSNYYYEVIVPENGLTLTIAADVAYDVTVDTETSDKVRTNITNEQAIKGGTVNFTYSAISTLYVIDDVYLENADGERLDITITQTPGYSNTSCSFIMPAGDVVICYDVSKAQTYTAAVNVTVPQGEELTKVMTGFTLSNRGSEVNIFAYTQGMTVDLVENTETNLGVTLASGYEATATYTYTVDEVDHTEDIAVSYMSAGRVTFASFMAPANIKSIDISITKTTPVKATVTHDNTVTDEEFAGLKFAYTVNGQSVTDLSSVYKGDSLGVTITSEAESGYVYLFEITDSEGNIINGSGSYRITGDFTITVSKVQAYTYEFVLDGVDQYSTYINLNLSDDSYYRSESGSGMIYGSGLRGRLTPTYVGSAVDYTVTVGGEEKVTGTFEAYSSEVYSDWFDINGNVVITITAHAE